MTLTRRQARRRGTLGTGLVLVLGAILAVAVLSSGAEIDPAAREMRRARTSDQAWVAAEGGLALAQVLLEQDPGYLGQRTVLLGRVGVELRIERVSADQREAVAVAHAQDPDGPQDASITRSVRARFLLREGQTPLVIDWEDR